MNVHQLLHLPGEIALGAAWGDVDMPPPTQGLDEEKEIGCAFPAILIIVPSGLSRAGRHGLPRFTDQLHRTFVKTDLWTPSIIRLGLPVQHILHMPDKFRTHTGDAPFFALPRLEVVFFRTRRTVSSEMASTNRGVDKGPADNYIGPGTRPAGGVLQARATKKASCLPSNLWIAPGRLRSMSALGSPPSTNRWRVRWRGEKPTRKIASYE